MLVWWSGLLWNALSALAFLFFVVSVRRHQCGFHVICTSWSTLIALFSHWAMSGGAGRDVHPTGSSAVGFGVVACSNELSSVKNRLLMTENENEISRPKRPNAGWWPQVRSPLTLRVEDDEWVTALEALVDAAEWRSFEHRPTTFSS